jgi:hypothetical protein
LFTLCRRGCGGDLDECDVAKSVIAKSVVAKSVVAESREPRAEQDRVGVVPRTTSSTDLPMKKTRVALLK